MSKKLHQLDLMHYGELRLQDLKNKKQSKDPQMKPNGLWVSVENSGSISWKEWCEAEDFVRATLDKPHQVLIKKSAQILLILSLKGLDDFHRKYRQPLYKGSKFCGINWLEVANGYQGIIISPYQYKRRLSPIEMFWYYPWDCASGCIWDVSAIEDVQPLKAMEGLCGSQTQPQS
jgi:hypothetical protein